MRVAVVVAAALLVAGCQSTKQVSEMSYSEVQALAGEIRQRCLDQGVADNTAQMGECLKIESDREVVMRQKAQIQRRAAINALADGMQNASNVYTQAAQNTYNNRPLTCTSRPTGAGQYETNCR